MATRYRPTRLQRVLNLQTMPLRATLEELRNRWAARSRQQQVEWDIDIPLGLTATADAALMATAIGNLIENALDAMPDGGELTITACRGRHGLEIEVADSGPGMPHEMATRVFEPFVSGPPNRVGLGLAVAAEIAAAHQGVLIACGCPEGGTAVTIRIPEQYSTTHRAAA